MDRINSTNVQEDFDFLIDVADISRKCIEEDDREKLTELIQSTVYNGLYEAFSWIIEIIQESYTKANESHRDDFLCKIGSSIPDYDTFIKKLGADMHVLKNEVEIVPDENGEPQAFFNSLTYRTKYDNVFLVTSENFDTRDNDFIQYYLLFSS